MTTTTRIEVTAGDGVPRCRLSAGPLAVRRLSVADPGSVRVALVAAGALLLAGDEVRIEVAVDGPVTVEVVETAGTVAYDMRGGRARWDVYVELTGGARIAWHGEPFVVAGGASVDRSTTGLVGAGSVLALRETLVFGRAGEVGGALRTRTRIDLGGVPALAEDLDLSPAGRARWTTMRGQRCLDTVTTVGARLPDERLTLQAELEASVARSLSDEAHRSTMAGVWSAARAAVAPRIPA